MDAIHVSTGSSFPHPRNPAGPDLDVDLLSHTYEQLASSGTNTFRNLLLFHNTLSGELFRKQWQDAGVPKDEIEGLTLPDAHIIKQAVPVPVICTGGFQTASVIRKAITDGQCDAVSIARPLVANNDLVKQFAAGRDRAERPCTYCNKCLLHVVEHPLGCYEESRFPSRRGDAAGSPVGLSAAGLCVMATVRRLLKALFVGAVVVASAVVVWAVVSLRADRPTTYEDIQEHFKYGSIGSEPGGSLLHADRRRAAAVLGVQGAAVGLQRQAAGRQRRLRTLRLHQRAGQGSADWRVAAPAAGHRSGRAQLRRLPHGHRPRAADARRRGSCSACRRSGSTCRRSSSSSSTARSTTG